MPFIFFFLLLLPLLLLHKTTQNILHLTETNNFTDKGLATPLMEHFRPFVAKYEKIPNGSGKLDGNGNKIELDSLVAITDHAWSLWKMSGPAPTRLSLWNAGRLVATQVN